MAGQLDPAACAMWPARIAAHVTPVTFAFRPGGASGVAWHLLDVGAYVPAARGAASRPSNYLTVDETIIKALPCRVELATEKWDALIDEGMRLTQQKIESAPILSAFLPGWRAEPRAEKHGNALAIPNGPTTS